MTKDKTLILTSRQISQKIERIAHHIYEIHYKEKEIVIVGIKDRGYIVAARIAKVLKEISSLNIELHSITLNKDNPLDSLEYDGELGLLKGKVVILVDDVLNSGRTLIFAVREILTANPKILATATLIDRIHRKFPIRADYVGLTLSTNLKEHITVEMGGKKEAVYLE
jgi:pyrimidine operon attenuation protein / uracil phosphoribosyltransferase